MTAPDWQRPRVLGQWRELRTRLWAVSVGPEGRLPTVRTARAPRATLEALLVATASPTGVCKCVVCKDPTSTPAGFL